MAKTNFAMRALRRSALPLALNVIAVHSAFGAGGGCAGNDTCKSDYGAVVMVFERNSTVMGANRSLEFTRWTVTSGVLQGASISTRSCSAATSVQAP